MDYLLIASVVVSMTIYSAAARLERRNPVVWAGASLAIWLLTALVFHFSFRWSLAAQLLPYAAMYALNLKRPVQP